ncbi:MAG: 2-amino-4-hydroxy-6-hydroxymethyldihydropteridine diphosphokinase [Vicingaceae bacterium]|nr:2-amino-4-hydroxy-6-hydroxymethyldihydropteridine diphosphokinase [Vicingaceae bacterium]
MSNKVILGLGGNVGNVQFTLKNCIQLIELKVGKVDVKSSLYQTKAWGVENQPDFINQVVVINTNLSAHECLSNFQDIEKQMGRIRKEKWHERTIDIDILFYNNDIIEEDNLKIPHPFIQDRNFVIYPLDEIVPNLIHPQLNKSMLELKNICKDKLMVIKL